MFLVASAADTTRYDRGLYITELRPFESHLGSDHYNECQPGPFFQLHLLYRLVLLLERLNVLEARPPAVDCAICLTATVEAAGEVWHQLEPCRHWLCGGCGESWMQAQAQGSCPISSISSPARRGWFRFDMPASDHETRTTRDSYVYAL